MDTQDYSQLLRLQSAELTGRTAFCPEDQEIAEYFDAELSAIERAKLEHHLNTCHFCLARIGILDRLVVISTNKRIPEAVLASTKQMTPETRIHQQKMTPLWAAAAVLVLAVFITTNPKQEFADPAPNPPSVPFSGENSRQLRSLNRNAMSIDVLNPAPGASIQPGALIRWSEIPGNLHYKIFILSNNGDVLWTQRLGGTDWVLSDSLPLATDSKYFFRVEAQLPDGRTASSRHIVFQISGQ